MSITPAARPPGFRRRALGMIAKGKSVAPVAKVEGISEPCMRRWMEQDATDGGSKEGLTSPVRNELVEMRR